MSPKRAGKVPYIMSMEMKLILSLWSQIDRHFELGLEAQISVNICMSAGLSSVVTFSRMEFWQTHKPGLGQLELVHWYHHWYHKLYWDQFPYKSMWQPVHVPCYIRDVSSVRTWFRPVQQQSENKCIHWPPPKKEAGWGWLKKAVAS